MPRPSPHHPRQVAGLADADLCVKCGLCLPHCPTYRETLDEGESPRGRIALMQGLASGVLPASAKLEGHLDRCLSCRACEAVCPAQVPYGRLMDSARELLAQARPQRTRLPRLIAAVLVHKPLRFALALLLWIYQRLGLQALLRKTRVLGRGRLARLESLLPAIHLPRRPATQAHGGEPRPALFTNCTSPLVEPETLQAAVTLLEKLGCEPGVPRAQTCCGALHQHNGLSASARRCAATNLEAFATAETVVGIASGCTAQQRDYPDLAPGPQAKAFAEKAVDIHGYIARHPESKTLRFKPLNMRVLLHTPCTLRNVLKDDAAVHSLLSRIPGLEVQFMDSACCGAAGSFFLTQPELADRLVQPKVTQAAQAQPAYVLSSNVGCAMHLAAGLRRAGLMVPVWHPVRLLARQLDGSGSPPDATAAAPPARPG